MYTTIKKSVSAEITVTKSKFITYLSPVNTETDAEEFLKSIRKKHNDARHNVFAFILKNGVKRYSDDGEPQGTAGLPTLGVLASRELCDCIAVTTRYFGGILLGTGGLNRAYTESVKTALLLAEKSVMIKGAACVLECDYNQHKEIAYCLNKANAKTLKTDYQGNIRIEFVIENQVFSDFKRDIFNKTAGKVVAVKTDEIYFEKQSDYF